jgi:hypothetical protein
MTTLARIVMLVPGMLVASVHTGPPSIYRSTRTSEPAGVLYCLTRPGATAYQGPLEEITMRLTTVGLITTFTLAILVAPLVTGGQQSAKVVRIGVLMPAINPERTRNLAAFRDALRDLGWVEGQNLAMESRFAEQGLGQFPELATDLVRREVDVLVVGGGAPWAPTANGSRTLRYTAGYRRRMNGERL